MKLYILALLISVHMSEIAQAQKTSTKAFSEAKLIRVYVTDSTKNEALIRFAKFIDKTGFTAYIPDDTSDQEKENQNNDINVPKLVTPKQTGGSSQVGDTIVTDKATLYDAMWGDFEGRLKFYPALDEGDKIYIAITGFASNSHFGGSFSDLQMQKAGNANWAQKTLFKQLNKHIGEYTNVTNIVYSDK